MKDLQKLLFDFAKRADHLTQELFSAPETPDVLELQAYLRVIARKAEGVASAVGQESLNRV